MNAETEASIVRILGNDNRETALEAARRIAQAGYAGDLNRILRNPGPDKLQQAGMNLLEACRATESYTALLVVEAVMENADPSKNLIRFWTQCRETGDRLFQEEMNRLGASCEHC